MRQLSIATLLMLLMNVSFATKILASEPPLTTLVLQDRVITISKGAKGLVYSVKTQSGTVLDNNLSDAELQAKYPDIYETIRPTAENQQNHGIHYKGETQHTPTSAK